MTTCAVTGGTGHLGANLVPLLLARGNRVRVVANQRPCAPALAGLELEVVVADVRDFAAMRQAFSGVEVVYHLAAVISIHGDPSGLVRSVNVGGARTAAEAALAAKVRRFVHTSSVHAFDHAPIDAPLDEGRARPGRSHPAYDRSKADGEAAVREVIARGLDAVIVNPSGVIGPRDFAPSRMGTFFLELARGRWPALPAGGFDWVDARDVASSIIAAAEHGRTGENYLLGGRWHSVATLADMAAAATGVARRRIPIPMPVARGLSRVVAPAMRLARRANTFTPDAIHALRGNRRIRWDKAARELGHRARPTEQTVVDLYDSFAARGLLALPVRA